MHKLILGILTIFLTISGLKAEETGPLEVYLPTQETGQAYFGMYNYLLDWEKNPAKIDLELFDKIYANQTGSVSMESLVFENFLRQTRNPEIKALVMQYFLQKKIATPFSQVVKDHFNSTPVNVKVDGSSPARYSLEGKVYDEGIDYFNFSEVSFFADELGMILPKNDWKVLTFKNKEDGSADKNSFFLTLGGGTNALSVFLKKVPNIEASQVMDNLELKYFKEKYKAEPYVYDLPLEGEIARSGTDRFVLVYNFGKDIIPEIECGDFSVFLYKASKKTLYRINYFVNFSPPNLHFSERLRIYQYLLLNLTYSFLN